MTENIITAQKEVATENNLTFYGDGAAEEASMIEDMSNQLRAVLYDTRLNTVTEGAVGHGINELRKCPHCGLVWAKIVGCNGLTTCGQKVQKLEARNNGVMATFTFIPEIVSAKLESLQISQSGVRKAVKLSSNCNTGCGKYISWRTMEIVPIPSEFYTDASVTTDDLAVDLTRATGVKEQVETQIKNITSNLEIVD